MSASQDARLEAAIEARRQELLAAATAEKRRDAWYSMKALIEARSVGQVRRMELERNLKK